MAQWLAMTVMHLPGAAGRPGPQIQIDRGGIRRLPGPRLGAVLTPVKLIPALLPAPLQGRRLLPSGLTTPLLRLSPCFFFSHTETRRRDSDSHDTMILGCGLLP